MAHAQSHSAIFVAFLANLIIALIKTAAAVWTGSAALQAEAVHSFADCGNQILLFVGLHRANRPATPKHPLGFGRESYIWSMMVAITLFSLGGLFSVYEGWQHLQHPQALENSDIALGILLAAVLIESWSLRGALRELQAERNGLGLWQWFRQTHSSELLVVVGEDIAALAGLALALLMLGLTAWTGNPVFDAAGSIGIGLMLIGVALLVGREVHSLLLGETHAEIQNAVQDFLNAQPGVLRVFNVWAVNHGRSVLLAIKAELDPGWSVAQATSVINVFEQQIKITHPSVQWIFFEIDNTD
jgi:cation diffusion facilitator family transporter